MPVLTKFSDAVAIAFHCGAALAQAGEGRLLSTQELAETFQVSPAHLALVMRRLVRAGIVDSVRGPRGGFRLLPCPDDVSLKDVFEAVEGPIRLPDCLFSRRLCTGTCCLFGEELRRMNSELLDYLAGTPLSRVARCLGEQAGFAAASGRAANQKSVNRVRKKENAP